MKSIAICIFIFILSVDCRLITKLHRVDRSASSEDNWDEADTISDETSHKHGAVNTNIAETFVNKRTFQCPRVKPHLHTGDDVSNISPEDIDIIAAMGDSLASGRGLWEGTDVDFRGAAFPIGGDANIDGLVTIPNILLEFNDNLDGVSHGMGERHKLPDYQYNVAMSGSESEDLPEQAIELLRRMNAHLKFRLQQKWTLIIIATGTEEFCNKCDTPHLASIRKALGILRKGIRKALVVLLGPVHVSSSYKQTINLLNCTVHNWVTLDLVILEEILCVLKLNFEINDCLHTQKQILKAMPRCPCLENVEKRTYLSLIKEWQRVFLNVQNEFNHLNYTTFGVLAIPLLTIHSRNPESLFVDDRPLLNRKGHLYAAKWLWNRLIYGPMYNISEIVLSQDTYYCPSVVSDNNGWCYSRFPSCQSSSADEGCPYFRTDQNLEHCSIHTEHDYVMRHTTTQSPFNMTSVPHRERVRQNLIGIIAAVIVLALISVCILGTYFYRRSLDAIRVVHHKDETVPLPEAKLGG